MSFAEAVRARPHDLNSILWRTAWVEFGGALVGAFQDKGSTLLPEYFLAIQDTYILLIWGLLCIVFSWLARNQAHHRFEFDITKPNPFHLACVAAVAIGSAVLVVRRFAYLDYALSIDEFMADFDARIIASGRLLASVAPEWREYVPALQPIFRLEVPENQFWVSA